jgi:hypothetical protein
MLTYSRLLDLIEEMTEEQQKMEVCVLVNDDYHFMTALLSMGEDFRDITEEFPDFEPLPKDQPILT